MKKIIVCALAALLLTACQESIEEKAAKEAQLFTRKNCPSPMGENLIVDSLSFERDTHTLHFYYTLTGNADSVELLNEDTVKTVLLKELKNTTTMMAYKEAGFRFAYTYRSQKNSERIIFDFAFTKNEYSKQ
jgi:hypothetical protein